MKAKKIIIILITLIVIAGIIIAYYSYKQLMSNAIEKEGSVYISGGATYSTLVDSLNSGGYIRDMAQFESISKLLSFNGNVRGGHYRLKDGTSYKDVVRMFQRGWQTPVRVTFNNMRTLPQLAGRVAEQIEPDSLSLATVFTSDTTAARYGFDRHTFIAMLIPNTYELYWNTTVAGFVERMYAEYEKFWTEERMKKLADTGLSQIEVITLASIVYEETKMSDEMATVAGVYINRLRVGMPLQADPTVKFAVGDFALRRVLHRHLEVDSPYNTYKYTGLPPGPICMPSITAIDAVLNYRRHKYIFFAAKPDFSGYHNFAITLAEHNRNADAYRRVLNAAGIR